MTQPERIELHIGHWPDRKQPLLTLYSSATNSHRVLARFVSDEAAEEFIGMIRERGVRFADESERVSSPNMEAAR